MKESKPHIFLYDDLAREKEWASSYTRRTEAIDEYISLIILIKQVVDTETLTKEDLEKISSYIESRFKFVWTQTGRKLVQLSHCFPQAGDKLISLMNHPKATIRLRIVQSLWTDIPPQQIAESILEKGLIDKSKWVRYFAEQRKTMIKTKKSA